MPNASNSLNIPKVGMNRGIYKLTNIFTQEIYIGSSINIKRRKYQHFHQLKNNKHSNSILQRVWNKYGESIFDFEIIEFCEKEIIIEREQYWIDRLNPKYNICKTAGSIVHSIYRPIYHLDKSFKIINEYGNLAEASNKLNIDLRIISECCSKKGKIKSYKDNVFCFKDDINIIKTICNFSYKGVYQYDLENNLINEYKSAGECKRKNQQFSISKICECASGKIKKHKGFIFKYKYE